MTFTNNAGRTVLLSSTLLIAGAIAAFAFGKGLKVPDAFLWGVETGIFTGGVIVIVFRFIKTRRDGNQQDERLMLIRKTASLITFGITITGLAITTFIAYSATFAFSLEVPTLLSIISTSMLACYLICSLIISRII